MSATSTTAAGGLNKVQSASASRGVRRRVAAISRRRWDDRVSIERHTSPSELALRSVPGLPRPLRY